MEPRCSHCFEKASPGCTAPPCSADPSVGTASAADCSLAPVNYHFANCKPSSSINTLFVWVKEKETQQRVSRQDITWHNWRDFSLGSQPGPGRRRGLPGKPGGTVTKSMLGFG